MVLLALPSDINVTSFSSIGLKTSFRMGTSIPQIKFNSACLIVSIFGNNEGYKQNSRSNYMNANGPVPNIHSVTSIDICGVIKAGSIFTRHPKKVTLGKLIVD